jgi:hypothetical protein
MGGGKNDGLKMRLTVEISSFIVEFGKFPAWAFMVRK